MKIERKRILGREQGRDIGKSGKGEDDKKEK